MRVVDFRTQYGPWALVAGASEGLGAEFALQLASRGLNLVLLARRPALLDELATRLRGTFAIEVRTLAVDLSSPDCVPLITAFVGDLEVGLLVYNAALSPLGPFLDLPLEQNLSALEVNVRTPTALAHHIGRRLATRGRGGLILLSSLTAFQGSPYVATYGATKSYNLALAEGLWFELRSAGVDVLAVCAGATATPNLLRAAPQGAPGMLPPAAVVADALSALGRRPTTIPGWFNRFVSFLMRRLFSRTMTISIMGSQTRKLQRPP
jgi:short-subunit dehydrogenase